MRVDLEGELIFARNCIVALRWRVAELAPGPTKECFERLAGVLQEALDADLEAVVKEGEAVTPSEQSYRPSPDISPDDVRVADKLSALAREHGGTFIFEHGYSRVVAERVPTLGVSIRFLTSKEARS